MIEAFAAGFLGIISGAALVSFLFHRAYVKERALVQEAADNMMKALSGETKAPRGPASIHSLFKDDKNKPVN